jgi:acetyl-CoA C-acetyltransferase
MSYDPRAPVIVGVGQVTQRVDRGEPPLEPVDLMTEALHRAETDAGARVLAAAESIRVLCVLSFRYRDPARLVADRLALDQVETVYTVVGGNYVQTLVNRTAREIQDGAREVVALCGAEAWRTRSELRRKGERPAWTVQDDDVEPTVLIGGDDPDLSHPAERARGITLPIQVYPMFESALRAHRGETIAENRMRIAALWSDFSAVAVANPYAWVREHYEPEEIAEPSEQNRMIGFPYTKRMNSNNAVEQGAALVLCSAEKASELGVPRDRWVFVHAGADAHDHWHVSNRHDLHSSPAMRAAGLEALHLAQVGSDDLTHVDLYSCFPSAVQVAADELGLGLDRPLTVTGGMSFAGGPWNNYVMHAVATMTEQLRTDPTATGLVSGNGGFLTKHAFGVYASRPPLAGRFQVGDVQEEVSAQPRRELAVDHTGPVTVEAYTVMHDRDGRPETAPIAARTPDGRRVWGTCTDDGVMQEMTTSEFVGRSAVATASGTIEPH